VNCAGNLYHFIHNLLFTVPRILPRGLILRPTVGIGQCVIDILEVEGQAPLFRPGSLAIPVTEEIFSVQDVLRRGDAS
jgi:hypothetical protein